MVQFSRRRGARVHYGRSTTKGFSLENSRAMSFASSSRHWLLACTNNKKSTQSRLHARQARLSAVETTQSAPRTTETDSSRTKTHESTTRVTRPRHSRHDTRILFLEEKRNRERNEEANARSATPSMIFIVTLYGTKIVSTI